MTLLSKELGASHPELSRHLSIRLDRQRHRWSSRAKDPREREVASIPPQLDVRGAFSMALACLDAMGNSTRRVMNPLDHGWAHCIGHLRRLCTVVFALVASAHVAYGSTSDLGAEVYVVFELCRPGHAISEGVMLHYRSVSDNGYGGLLIKATKFFDSSEPVYYSDSDNPDRLRAIVAQFSDRKDVRFVYLAPAKKDLQFDAWTSWIKPNAITSDKQAEGKILRSIPYAQLDYDAPSPKIRYKLMSFNDYRSTVTLRSSPPMLTKGGPCPSEN